jgi:hypothetical protein
MENEELIKEMEELAIFDQRLNTKGLSARSILFV